MKERGARSSDLSVLLSSARRRVGISQDEAARRLSALLGRSISIVSIQKWEQGVNRPTAEHFGVYVTKVLKVSLYPSQRSARRRMSPLLRAFVEPTV